MPNINDENQNNIQEEIDGLSDDALSYLQDTITDSVLKLSVPWQYDLDEDGFRQPKSVYPSSDKDDPAGTREALQELCWQKFHRNPMVGTSIRGLAGRIAGKGLDVSSPILDIQREIDLTTRDPRNRLYERWRKFVVRALVEGELFLVLTCNTDGFIEIDFIDPVCVKGSNSSNEGSVFHSASGVADSGIIFHPTKSLMPLVYLLKDEQGNDYQVPSIFVAMYPDLLMEAANDPNFDSRLISENKASDKRFSELGGFYRFVVSWDRGWMTERNIGHLRSVIEWANLYENLKKWEADYKKAASAYVWNYQFEDMKLFRQWLKLSDSDKKKTGIAQKKTPGSTIMTPPGAKLEVKTPQLPTISDDDRDILNMITAGTGEPEDVSTGQARGTYASVKMSRGPFADRTDDEVHSFVLFLTYTFWRSVFFLKNKVSNFPAVFKVKECIGFNDDEEKTPKMELVDKEVIDLIEISTPTSEVSDIESRSKALLGSKHGSVKDTLGIPPSKISEKLGFGNYRKLRLQHATEAETLPELLSVEDEEAAQEKAEQDKDIESNNKEDEKDGDE